MGWNYGYGYPMTYGYGHSWIEAAFSIFWIVLLIVLLVGAVRHLRHGKRRHWRCCGGEALEILRERYAKGEIDKTEYEERRKVLEQ